MSQTEWRHLRGEEKVSIPQLHLLEGKVVSGLWKQHENNPSLLYQWQRMFIGNGSGVRRPKDAAGRARSRAGDPPQINRR